MKVTCWLLLLSALQLVQGHLVLTRERREVGPVTQGHKKYRRLQHSIMVQADIRSRSGQPRSKYIVPLFIYRGFYCDTYRLASLESLYNINGAFSRCYKDI